MNDSPKEPVKSLFVEGRTYTTVGGWPAKVLFISKRSPIMHVVHNPDSPGEQHYSHNQFNGQPEQYGREAPSYGMHPANLTQEIYEENKGTDKLP